MSEEAPLPSPSLATVRPPDFVLPRAEGVVRNRPGETLVYVTWGGEIYGPATPEEVLAGIRSSWFEDSAHFWFEGREEWTPVGEFPRIMEKWRDRLPATRHSGTPQQSHTAPPAGPADRRPRRSRQTEHPRTMKQPRVPGHRNHGYWLVAGFILAAIGLTVGIILLIWRFI